MAFPRKKRKMTHGEARQMFDDMYARDEAKREAAAEAFLRTPAGELARQEFNKKTVERLRAKKNPVKRKRRKASPALIKQRRRIARATQKRARIAAKRPQLLKRNPSIRKQFIIELLHKNYGIWYVKDGNKASMQRAAAKRFGTAVDADKNIQTFLSSTPQKTKKNFIWIRSTPA